MKIDELTFITEFTKYVTINHPTISLDVGDLENYSDDLILTCSDIIDYFYGKHDRILREWCGSKHVGVVEIVKDNPNVKTPVMGAVGSAGYDIYATDDTYIPPFERVLLDTGIKLSIPKGFEIQVRPRSGLAYKKGITVLNTPGTIDAYYKDNVKILLMNTTSEPVSISENERIAQLVLKPVYEIYFKTVTSFTDKTDRGGGFGSTGAI